MDTGNDQVFTPAIVKPRKDTRGWGLNTLPAVRRRLAKILTTLDREDTDIAKARCLIYGLSIVASILKDEKTLDIEERLTRLEEAGDIVEG